MLLRGMRNKPIQISQGSFSSPREAVPSPLPPLGELKARDPRLRFTLGGGEGTGTRRPISKRFTSLEWRTRLWPSVGVHASWMTNMAQQYDKGQCGKKQQWLSTEHWLSFFINATSKLVTKLQATRDWLTQHSNRISKLSGLSSQMEMLDWGFSMKLCRAIDFLRL